MLSPKISVIVPIYNSETTIKRCVDSILAQKFTNFELLLVDDGCKDKSGCICDEYARKDNRIRVFHKESGGVSSARNQGLSVAKGEWIYFIDSDDWIEPQYLQMFIDALEDERIDMVIQSYVVENRSSIRTPNFNKRIFEKNYELVEYLEKHPDTHNGFLWHKLFRHSIIKNNGLHFDESTSYGEDEIFIMQYLLHVRLIMLLPTKGYHYITNKNSLTYKRYTTDFYFDQLHKYRDNLCALSDNKQYRYFVRQYLWRLIETWLIYP